MIRLILGLGNIGKKYEGTRHNVGFEVVDRLASMLKADWQPREREYDWAVAEGIGYRESGMEREPEQIDQPKRDSLYPIPHTPNPPQILLAKPRTYMNLSGLAARKLLEIHGVTPAEMLVVVDDFALPLGAVRIRGKGSDGGHNGLASIIEELETQSFPRIKLGIGQIPKATEKSGSGAREPGSESGQQDAETSSRAPGPEKSNLAIDKEEGFVDFVLGKFAPDERPAVDKMVAHAADAVLFALEHRLEDAMSKYNYNPALP